MPERSNTQAAARATRRTVLQLSGLAMLMFGFGFALVPLYNVFCEATGIKGKTGRITESAARHVSVDRQRLVTVEFLGSVNSGLPWQFAPRTARLSVHPGEIHEVRYYAHNTSERNTVGVAVPNIVPAAVSAHFKKVECFCFRQQVLAPGEEREMPVRFIVDPALPPEVTELSLSYTFFDSGNSSQKTGQSPEKT